MITSIIWGLKKKKKKKGMHPFSLDGGYYANSFPKEEKQGQL